MANTTFRGPVRTGKDTGAPATRTIGTLIAEQHATVSNTTSGASSMVIPANSRLADFTLQVLVSASGNAGGMLVRVGSTSDATKFAALNCSAVGTYRMGVAPNLATVSAAACESVGTVSQRLFIDVTAQASATNVENFSAILSISYVQR